MIKVGLSNRYKVDPYGTEEILYDASVSLAPKLTIDYGDEVQEAEFIVRPTKGGVDPNIDSVANILSIKGNTSVIEESLVNCKMSGIKTTDGNSNLLCINPIPVTSLKGKLNGQGSSVVVFSDGIKKAGAVYDEIKVENGVVKAIKRVGSADLGTVEMTYDSAYKRFKLTGITDIKWARMNGEAVNNLICAKYNTIKASSQSPQPNGIAVGINVSFGVLLYDSNYSSVSALQTAMNGVKVNYELATPEEYIIDDVSVEKVMLGSTEITKVYLGDQLIFESN